MKVVANKTIWMSLLGLKDNYMWDKKGHKALKMEDDLYVWVSHALYGSNEKAVALLGLNLGSILVDDDASEMLFAGMDGLMKDSPNFIIMEALTNIGFYKKLDSGKGPHYNWRCHDGLAKQIWHRS